MSSDIDGQIIKDQPTLHSARLIQRPVSRGIVSPRPKPNPDWGIAWGTGRTNNPSLYNVKYRASRISIKTQRPNHSHRHTQRNRPLSPSAYANGGARRDRTDDLLNANQALSQLSYGPKSLPHGPYRSSHDALNPRYGFHWPSGGAAKTFAEVLGFAFVQSNSIGRMVGTGGLEPPTSRLSGVCSNHLSYVPADVVCTDTSCSGPITGATAE